jgi:hypothetical protein
VTTSFTAPADGSTLNVSATLTDGVGNTSAPATDSATIDTSVGIPTVTITEDTDNDGIINSSELSGAADVSVTLPADAVAGDTITVTDGSTTTPIVLTAGDITAGSVTTSFTAPADGSTLNVSATLTDAVGNVSTPATDSAAIDTSAATPTVTITEDANNDGVISSSELSGAANVSVSLPATAVAGDTITVTDGTTSTPIVLTAGDITAGSVTTSFTAPADGSTLNVSATLTDGAGNVAMENNSPLEEANQLADRIAKDNIRSLVINMEYDAFDQGLAKKLADHLESPCYTLSELKADDLYRTVRYQMET